MSPKMGKRKFIPRADEMVQKVGALIANHDDLSLTLRTLRQKERTNPQKMSSDVHIRAVNIFTSHT